jgi:hypothetical protein
MNNFKLLTEKTMPKKSYEDLVRIARPGSNRDSFKSRFAVSRLKGNFKPIKGSRETPYLHVLRREKNLHSFFFQRTKYISDLRHNIIINLREDPSLDPSSRPSFRDLTRLLSKVETQLILFTVEYCSSDEQDQKFLWMFSSV